MKNLSIVDVEESIQNALECLRSKPAAQEITRALEFLVPEGYRPVVELQEEGRKKRRTASARNWSPETGEILISFSKAHHWNTQKHLERTPLNTLESPRVAAPPASISPQRIATEARGLEDRSASAEDPRQQDLRVALEEVEREGRAFVALKWFRDHVLPSKFSWAADPEKRQAILATAIENGLLVTSRIPNPRSSFPTTTVRLNRSQHPGSSHRFTPIKIQGEPLSSTLLRDRGER